MATTWTQTLSRGAARLDPLGAGGAATLLLMALWPLLQYPFAFHDDLLVPHLIDCQANLAYFGNMGRPAMGLTHCLQNQAFGGFAGTQSIRIVSCALTLASFGLVYRYAIREGVSRGESAVLSLLVFTAAPSVMIVYYVASSPQVYGNLFAIVSAVLAQQLSFAVADPDSRSVSFKNCALLLAVCVLGLAAYCFYQLSGVLYFAVIAVTATAAVARGPVLPGLGRFALLAAIGAVPFTLYALSFIILGAEVHASGKTFGFTAWLEKVDLPGLAETFFAAPWGVMPRVMAPWRLAGPEASLAPLRGGGLFVIALGRLMLELDRRSGARGRTRLLIGAAGLFAIASIFALLYSPVIASGARHSTYRVLFPIQVFVTALTVAGGNLILQRLRLGKANWVVAAALCVVASINAASYAHRELALPARAEIEYVAQSIREAAKQDQIMAPVHLLIPGLKPGVPHDEYGHLSSYYSDWGNRDAALLINLVRAELGYPRLTVSAITFDVGNRSRALDPSYWVIDFYPLVATGLYAKHDQSP